MQQVSTYSFDGVVLSWGPVLFTGFAKGSAIKVSKPETKQVTAVQGNDGYVARAVRRHAPLRSVEVTLMQTSETNELLKAQAEIDRLTGQGVYSMVLKDLSGTTLYEWPQAWIAERPEGEFSNEITNRVWVLEGVCVESEGLNA